MNSKICLGLFILLGLIACKESFFPKEISMIYPLENPQTKDRIALGKKMFFSTSLSVDSSVSCATCHQPKYAFADNRPITPGVAGRLATRNAPSLVNVGYSPTFMFDGFLTTLEKQAIVPIEEHNEMAFNMVLLYQRLQKDSTFVRMARKAYGRVIDPFVITRSLGAFQRSLIFYSTKYDKVQVGKAKFSKEEEQGRKLFTSKLNCAKCHSGPNFTDYSVRSNGIKAMPIDSGRMRVTHKEIDRNLYKVPTLRNWKYTAPYMHDGRFQTIDEVLNHYQSGGTGVENQDPLIQSFVLTAEEKKALLAFLNTLNEKPGTFK